MTVYSALSRFNAPSTMRMTPMAMTSVSMVPKGSRIMTMPSTMLSTASSRKPFQLGYWHLRSSSAFWMRPRLSKMTNRPKTMGRMRTTMSLRMMRNAPSPRQTRPEIRVSWLWKTPRSTAK